MSKLVSLVAVIVLALAVAAPAMAGKPPKGGGSAANGTIKLVLLNSTDGVAHYGQNVRFDVSTTATTEPWVSLKCYQRRTLVAQGSEGYFEGALSDGVFGLYSGAWSGGAADCTANLTKPDGSVLATTSFHVEA